jgi:hypothetical protein
MICVLTHGVRNIVLRGGVLSNDGLETTEIILTSSGWQVILQPVHLPPVQVQGLVKEAVLPWLTGQLRALELTEFLDYAGIWGYMGILESFVAEFSQADASQTQF